MRISILNPQKTIYECNAKQISLPGEGEEFTVLDFHQPAFFCLGSGVIKIEDESHTTIPVRYGFARMASNELSVLVEA